MEEEGVVIDIKDGRASVLIMESGGCQGCQSGGSCKSAKGGRVLEATNRARAQVGQRVVVGIDAGAFMKASIFVYMTPVLLLFVGAYLGGAYGPGIYPGISQDAWQALGGIIFLALSLLLLRLYGRAVSREKVARAVVVKIVEGDACCAPSPPLT